MPLRTVLTKDLLEARKAREPELVALIRALIAAIDNAEAVESVDGGRTEVPRRSLSDDDVLSIIAAEGAELRHAADDFDRMGRVEEAQRLRSLALVVDRYANGFNDSRP